MPLAYEYIHLSQLRNLLEHVCAYPTATVTHNGFCAYAATTLQITMEQIQEVVDAHEVVCCHVECSALTGEGVEEVFQEACRVGLEDWETPVKPVGFWDRCTIL